MGIYEENHIFVKKKEEIMENTQSIINQSKVNYIKKIKRIMIWKGN